MVRRKDPPGYSGGNVIGKQIEKVEIVTEKKLIQVPNLSGKTEAEIREIADNLWVQLIGKEAPEAGNTEKSDANTEK